MIEIIMNERKLNFEEFRSLMRNEVDIKAAIETHKKELEYHKTALEALQKTLDKLDST